MKVLSQDMWNPFKRRKEELCSKDQDEADGLAQLSKNLNAIIKTLGSDNKLKNGKPLEPDAALLAQWLITNEPSSGSGILSDIIQSSQKGSISDDDSRKVLKQLQKRFMVSKEEPGMSYDEIMVEIKVWKRQLDAAVFAPG